MSAALTAIPAAFTPSAFATVRGESNGITPPGARGSMLFAAEASICRSLWLRGSGGLFPGSTYNATNYWVDVVFVTT